VQVAQTYRELVNLAVGEQQRVAFDLPSSEELCDFMVANDILPV